jgi:hypothetical protein
MKQPRFPAQRVQFNTFTSSTICSSSSSRGPDSVKAGLQFLRAATVRVSEVLGKRSRCASE